MGHSTLLSLISSFFRESKGFELPVAWMSDEKALPLPDACYSVRSPVIKYEKIHKYPTFHLCPGLAKIAESEWLPHD
jgi:hypothetical protein